MKKTAFTLFFRKMIIKCASTLTLVSMALAACAPGTAPETVTESIPPSATNTLTPTETATPAPANTGFSEKYPVEFEENYVAEIYGMKIPISIGLSHWVMTRPDAERPISEVHIADDVLQIYADIWLKSCWYRYTYFMEGNEDVTFDEYLDKVRVGQGDVVFVGYDESTHVSKPSVIVIHPELGFAHSFVDQSLPTKFNDLLSIYYAVNGDGRLLIAQKLDRSLIESMEATFGSYPDGSVDSAIFNDLYQNALGIFVSTEEKCLMYDDVLSTCGNVSIPVMWADEITMPMTDEIRAVLQGTRSTVFQVVEK